MIVIYVPFIRSSRSSDTEVNILIVMEPFEQRAGLKSDLTNYRLNSSILVIRSVSFWPGQPSIAGTIRGVAVDNFLKSPTLESILE
jgi:hypothetical protein